MSEFYGSGHMVPYNPKDISNFRSGLRCEDKECDLAETIAYFNELLQDDPAFFYRVMLDSENWVQNWFWVDGEARHQS
jgi:hypothetical protein